MSSKLRVRLLLAVFVILIGLNLYVQLGESGFDSRNFFGDGTGLDTNYSATLTRNLEDIRNSPKLAFRDREKSQIEPNIKRNPFIFGADRQAEAAQQERLKALEAARQEVLEAAKNQPLIVEVQPEPEPGFQGEVVGIFENLSNGVRKATLRTEEGLLTIAAGDLINRRFRVLEVTYAQILMRDLKEQRNIELQVSPKP